MKKNESMFNLIQRVKELREKHEKKALDIEASKQKELEAMLKEEEALGKENEKNRKAVSRMEQKASMDQPDPEIRKKKTEIIRKALKQIELQEKIFHFLTYPGKILADQYKELSKYIEREILMILDEGPQARYKKKEIQHALSFAEKGKSGFSSGYCWDDITKAEAQRLIHDPVFPEKEIPSLIEQLSEIPDGSRVTVSYHQPGSFYPGLPVEVNQTFGESKVVKSNVKSEG